jgi:heme exporter protein D
MMPELGKYAAEVISAYVVSLALLGGIVWASLRQGARTRAELRDVEARRDRADG